MNVSTIRAGIQTASPALRSVPGEGRRSAALAWLAGRLAWEERLTALELPARRPARTATSDRPAC